MLTLFLDHWTWTNWLFTAVFTYQTLIAIKSPCPGHTAGSQRNWTTPVLQDSAVAMSRGGGESEKHRRAG